jgi:hypothetical protein
VGWGLIAYGLYWFVQALRAILVLSGPECAQIFSAADPRARDVALFSIFVDVGYYIISSLFDVFIGMSVLAGANWARILYSVMSVLLFLIQTVFWRGWVLILQDTVFAIIVTALLFLPGSNQYFRAPKV